MLRRVDYSGRVFDITAYFDFELSEQKDLKAYMDV